MVERQRSDFLVLGLAFSLQPGAQPGTVKDGVGGSAARARSVSVVSPLTKRQPCGIPPRKNLFQQPSKMFREALDGEKSRRP
eukprot:6009057-Pyramimonas_sp.AAC.1